MTKMTRKLTSIILAAGVLFTLAACARSVEKGGGEELSVVVTTDALYELVTIIGGGRIAVLNLVGNAEPHDFEPKPRDLEVAMSADLFIYNGLGLDDWAERINVANKLAASDAAAHPLEIGAEHDHGHDHDDHDHDDEEEHDGHDHGHHHHEGGYDPHLWLSPSEAADMAVLIANRLAELDETGREEYLASCGVFVAQMDALSQEFAEKFAASQRKTFVTGHAALGYLARYFGLTQLSVSDVFASGEPTAKQLAELAVFCRENNVSVVLAEEAPSKDATLTLARECGASVVVIYTMERAEDGLGFVERMRHNLESVLLALG